MNNTEYLMQVKNILNRELTSQDGIKIEELELKEEELNITLPNVIKDYYKLFGNISAFMHGFNHFIKPNEWVVLDNKLVFLKENQSVIYWAIELKEPFNVYQTTNISQPIWYSEPLILEEFLEMMFYFQAIMSEEFEFLALLQNNVDKFLTHIQNSWICKFKHQESAIYQKDKSYVLCLFSNETELYLASKDEATFKALLEKYDFEEL